MVRRNLRGRTIKAGEDKLIWARTQGRLFELNSKVSQFIPMTLPFLVGLKTLCCLKNIGSVI